MGLLLLFIRRQMGEDNMDKKNIRIMLDIWAGPIWGCRFNEEENTYEYHIESIANDRQLMELHQTIQDLFSSYYHFDYKDEPVYFDEEQEKKDKYKMLDLLNQLNKRLDELNDGSFVVDDRETDRVRNL